ncbi:MAG: fumarate reductase flavoprotein subunit [Rhizobiaceae bacterium MnEN-MB40S]|nr:MAG: fumarate reductase flavoprotein subunit [Rhizobiaceae bacterium MnEN-MB40S]
MDPQILPASDANPETFVDVVIIGAGACGLTAAMAAAEKGADVIVLERDKSPRGSTSMSSGFIPAAGTKTQKAMEIDDNAELLYDDIMAKSHGLSHPATADLAARSIGPAIDWLGDAHGVEWIVIDDFLYPGFSRPRMHTLADKTGEALEMRLLDATETAGVPVVTEATVDRLYCDGRIVTAVGLTRPDGKSEVIGCKAVILACCGFGGDSELVAKHIQGLSNGVFHGHAGNTGDALKWGTALGAATRDLSGCQGHGSLAHPHGIPIPWALMSEGGIAVNLEGKRFSNESGGYSEQAEKVLAQPDGVAWEIFDERLHTFGGGFPNYREALELGAVKRGETIEELAAATKLPADALAASLAERHGTGVDRLGRDLTNLKPLVAPYYAIKVTGALFHTQGGLLIDDKTRVVDAESKPFPNLLAGGGAACGVSGPQAEGYLSGNGLLTAIAFGWVAGQSAADIAAQ